MGKGNRTIPKRKKMGYALFIKRTDSKTVLTQWERVGFLFTTSKEAGEYRDRHFPSVPKWSIQSVRVTAGAVQAPEASDRPTTGARRKKAA